MIVNYTKLLADDCKLYGTVDNSPLNSMQADLNNLVEWSQKWQLPFNENKCKVMHLGFGNRKLDYFMDDHCLETVESEKDLGVIVDDELKFRKHAAAVTKKANQFLGTIKRTYQTRDAGTISTLYKAMVRPHLEYANSIWGPFYQGDINMVEKIQHRATKLIPSLSNKPYEERLMALKLPSLVYRRKRGDMIQMYKIMNKLIRIDAGALFTSQMSAFTRGHTQRVFKQHAKKNARVFSFSQRVTNDWNSLPQFVVSAPSLNIFKNRLDKFWKDLMYKTNH